MPNHFTCVDCGTERPVGTGTGVGTGYATTSRGKVCYRCCAEFDRNHMRKHGAQVLYLVDSTEITNWPGSLRFPVKRFKIGRHNIAGRRYDAWFDFDGSVWHGVTYGDNTQICRVRRTKEAA